MLCKRVIIFSSNYSIAQDTTQYNFVDYTQPKEYILSKVNVIGVKYVNKSNILDISGLKINQIINHFIEMDFSDIRIV
mgnify:CR=1 FL=1